LTAATVSATRQPAAGWRSAAQETLSFPAAGATGRHAGWPGIEEPSVSENIHREEAIITSPAPHRAFRTMAFLFGFAAILCSWWSAAILMFTAGRVIVVNTHMDGYRPATFTIEKLIFIKPFSGRGRVGSTPGRIYAEGNVGGQHEEFDLGAYLKAKISSQEDLERQFSVGERLAVYYNPEVPDTVRARLLYPSENFRDYWRGYLARTLRVAYLPLVIALGLTLLAGWAGRTWAGVKFAAASLFFVILGAALVLFDILA
jgi:hypothetical protein